MAAAAPILREREIVQDLGKEAPEKFYQKNVKVGIADGSLPSVDLPVIDISLLTSPSPFVARAEARKLGSALTTYSSCFIVNHGMESSFLDSMRDLEDDFFGLPLEEKLKSVRKPDHWEGYGFDQYPKDLESHEWSDRLMVLVTPERNRRMEYWPSNPTNFKNIMDKFCEQSLKTVDVLLTSMAKSLDLEDEKCFVEELGEMQAVVRFNYYPPCSTPDRVLGVNEHTDPSVLAFLVLDKEVEGTHIVVDGQWFRIPVESSEMLLVQVGDIGEIMSNGVFEASLHRAAVNTEKTRATIGIFFGSDPDKSLGPVEELVTETRPARYQRVSKYHSDHIKYADNRRLLDSKKI